jgi:hypothetical protein
MKFIFLQFRFLLSGFVAALLVFLDALLMQKWSQFVAITSAVVKAAYLWVSVAIGANLSLRDVLMADVFSALTGALIALIFLYKWGRHGDAPADKVDGVHDLRTRMMRFSAFNYFAQVIMSAYSQDAIKLIISRSINVLASAKVWICEQYC